MEAQMETQTLKQLFDDMLRIRVIEEKIADAYGEQEMRCPVHLCIGQEAIASGVCAALDPEDQVLSGHRAHGHYLAKGGNLKSLMAEIYGKANGCSQGKGGSMHLIDLSVGFLGSTPIVGSTIPIAVGAALGAQMRSEQKVTVVFFGDGATEEGVFHESLNFAVLKQLPIVFICENNLFSVYSPLSVRQPEGRDIYSLAKAFGVPSFQADGNEVEDVYKLANEAVQRARNGGGPTFLEFKTYRYRDHVGPFYDFDLGYRPESELKEWQERCPIELLKARMLGDGSLSNDDVTASTEGFETEIAEAISYAKSSPFPEESDLFEDIYAS